MPLHSTHHSALLPLPPPIPTAPLTPTSQPLLSHALLFPLLFQELKKFRDVPSVELFFSAHGVPKSYVEEAGDPYKEEMEECVRLITDEVGRAQRAGGRGRRGRRGGREGRKGWKAGAAAAAGQVEGAAPAAAGGHGGRVGATREGLVRHPHGGDLLLLTADGCICCVRNLAWLAPQVKRRGFANTHTLAYQSRVGPAEWLKPYTDESIK